MPSGLRREPSDGPSGGFLLTLGTLVVLIAVMSLIHIGCRRQQQTPPPTVEAAPPPTVQPIDDGSGMLYFPVTGEQYRASLAAFYANNPGKRCDLQGFTEDVVTTGVYHDKTARTITTGFILHCHDVAVSAQDVTVP